MAAEAVEIIFAASSSSAAKRGTSLQRDHRDVAMYRGTSPRRPDHRGRAARVHFGLPESLFRSR